MFETYHNIPTSYIPNNMRAEVNEYKTPLAEYNIKGDFIGYSWNCGDSIVLEFTTEGDVTYKDLEFYEDAETYLSGKLMTLSIYNFRHEVMYTQSLPAATVVKFYINGQLVEGVYSCELVLTDSNDTIQTLVSSDDYKLIIK